MCPPYYCFQHIIICCFKQNTVSTLVFNIHLFNFSLSTCYSLIMLHSANYPFISFLWNDLSTIVCFFVVFFLAISSFSELRLLIFILFLMYNITELMYYVTELNILWFNQSINHLNPSNKDLCNSYWYIIFSVYCKVISTMVTRQWL
jgi:hypothetical protein